MTSLTTENLTPEEFREHIIAWYRADKLPEVLIDDIMKNYPVSKLGPFLEATPETVARILMKEYAVEHQLIYQMSPKEFHHYMINRLNAQYHY